MSTLEDRCLEAIPHWLSLLGDDARELAELLGVDGAPHVKGAAALGLTFLVRSLEFISEVEEQGFAEAAIVLRVAAERVPAEELVGEQNSAALQTLARLGQDAALVREFLGEEFELLLALLHNPAAFALHGKTYEQLLEEPEALADLAYRARQFADQYSAPSFARDPKSLIKLRAYLRVKTSPGA
ncbi:MAG TPA: hypothetical protein VFQ61_24480 [Polyangiaceae bacterium]|nr:hypothetical protein [Polyangiaceae bacterium]